MKILFRILLVVVRCVISPVTLQIEVDTPIVILPIANPQQ